MASHLVNLDALIAREDFESGDAISGPSEPIFKLGELSRTNLYFTVLRKPDFQRHTWDWSPELVVDFVKCFLDNELIPPLILWHSKNSGKIFVIDGSHRLSALIAWVNDDYGDGEITRKFFGYDVPPAQKKFHKKTQALMAESVGTFERLHWAALHESEVADADLVRRGRAIATRQVPIQKVEGDAAVAERSFFKINQNPATISPTELDLVRARRKPNAIATRALIQAGKGHKYWGKFPANAKQIEELAADIYKLLFGLIVEIGSQSPDVPRAGQPYSAEAFSMILDMVNIFNEIAPAMWQEREGNHKASKKPVSKLADDSDGSKTLEFLNRIREIARLVADNSYAGSLGFDQAVYSYGATGQFHPAAFIASLKLAQELEQQKKLLKFTDVRKDFEDFLVQHKSFINDLTHSKGSRTRSLDSLLTLHRLVLQSMWDGAKGDAEIIAQLLAEPKLRGLKQPVESDDDSAHAHKKFSKAAERIAIVRDTLATRARCTECGARLPPFARSKDHKTRQENGGLGTPENLQFTHPYCNTGYKEARIAKAAAAD